MRGRKKFEFTPRYLLIIFTLICAVLLGVSAFLGTEKNPLSNITSASRLYCIFHIKHLRKDSLKDGMMARSEPSCQEHCYIITK